MNIDHKQTSAVMSQCNSFSPLAILASVWKKMVSHTGCPNLISINIGLIILHLVNCVHVDQIKAVQVIKLPPLLLDLLMSQCNSFSSLAILASVWKKWFPTLDVQKKIKMCVFRGYQAPPYFNKYRLNHFTPGKFCTCRSDKSCSSYKTPSPPSRFMNKIVVTSTIVHRYFYWNKAELDSMLWLWPIRFELRGLLICTIIEMLFIGNEYWS
jgi:hypothetical protein